VATWWREDVPAVAADVETVAEAPAGVVGDLVTGMAEVEVHASPTGGDGATRRKWAVLADEVVEGGVAAMTRIDVQDYEAALGACTDADVRVGPSVPPHLDLAGVCGRRVEPTADARMLGW
jgi:hypothetical protein